MLQAKFSTTTSDRKTNRDTGQWITMDTLGTQLNGTELD